MYIPSYFNGLRVGGSCFAHCFQTAFSNMLHFLHLCSISESCLWQFCLLTAFILLLCASKLAKQHWTIRESLCPPSLAFVRLCPTAHFSMLSSRILYLRPHCSCQWIWKNGLIALLLQICYSLYVNNRLPSIYYDSTIRNTTAKVISISEHGSWLIKK